MGMPRRADRSQRPAAAGVGGGAFKVADKFGGSVVGKLADGTRARVRNGGSGAHRGDKMTEVGGGGLHARSGGFRLAGAYNGVRGGRARHACREDDKHAVGGQDQRHSRGGNNRQSWKQ